MASATVNKVTLLGYLGADPDFKTTPSGAVVATFNIATNQVWKDKDGNKKEETDWHRCVAWRKLAEIIGEYLHKGSRVYLEGRLKSRSWEDKDGLTRYITEVIVGELKMLDSKGDGKGNYVPPPDEAPVETYHETTQAESQAPVPANAPTDDDLPF